jgi:23S rRNA pseudouridine1911/1915/1917 synthase
MQNITYCYKGENPVTLQKFLKSQGVSSRLIKKLKRQNNGITRNGMLIRSVDMVQRGDIISLNTDDERFLEPNGNLNVNTAYENAYAVIFDKPAFMPVHPSVKHQGDTLGNYFAYLYPELTFRPVNRLDKITSGLCAVAKNPHSANMLQNRIKKTYYAVVCGQTPAYGTIDAPIARENESIILRTVREDGKKAVTHYRTLTQNDEYSLTEIHLETGRTHQIRVHFSYIGFPLAGDELYGGSLKDIKRQALHCGIIEFSDIFTGKKITIRSDIKEDMLNLINKKGEF